MKRNPPDALPKDVVRAFHLKGTPYSLRPPFLGKGAYGICCSATYSNVDEKAGVAYTTDVAIKKIQIDSLCLHDKNRIIREIRMLRKMEHENIVKIHDVFSAPPGDLYIAFRKMDLDLQKVIQGSQQLSSRHIQFIMYQILKALKFLHSADVIHRDLKPANVLIDSRCHVEICDFGMARIDDRGSMTQYVCTRIYRAPELLMNRGQYGKAIDMWSVGCILAELLHGSPLFNGKDYISQMTSINLFLGSPTRRELHSFASPPSFQVLERMPRRDPVNLVQFFPRASFESRDLVGRLLRYDPGDRLTVVQALQHPYFRSLHDPREEPVCVPEIRSSLAQVRDQYDRPELVDEILKELLLYHPNMMTPRFLGSFNHPVTPVDLHRYLHHEKATDRQNKLRQAAYNCMLKDSDPSLMGRAGPLAPMYQYVGTMSPMMGPMAPMGPMGRGGPVAPMGPMAQGGPMTSMGPMGRGGPVAPMGPMGRGGPMLAPMGPGRGCPMGRGRGFQ